MTADYDSIHTVRLSRRWGWGLASLIGVLVVVMLGWRMALFGQQLLSWGDKTQQYGLSLGGLAILFAVSCGVMALLFLAIAIRAALSRDFVNRMDI